MKKICPLFVPSFFPKKAALLFCFTLMACLPAARAALVVSAQSGNWNLPATWVGGLVPLATDDITIAAGTTVSITDTRECNDLTINAIGVLNIETTGTFTQAGSTTIDGGLFLWGNFNNPYTISIGSSGYFEILGGTLSTIGGSMTGNGTFKMTSGIFKKTGPLLLTISAKLEMTGGEIQADGGNLTMTGVSNHKNFSGGTMNIASGFLNFGNTTCNVSGTAAFTGTGTLYIDFGTYFYDQIGITPGGPVIIRGSYDGTGSPTFANGFAWVTGDVQGSGTVHVTGPMNIFASASRILGGSKKILLTGIGTFDDGVIGTMNAGTVFEIATGGEVNLYVLASGLTWGATGTGELRISGGLFKKTGSAPLAIKSTVNMTAGSFQIENFANTTRFEQNAFSVPNNFSGGSVSISNNSTLKFKGLFDISNVPITGDGTVLVESSTVNFGPGAAVSPIFFTQTGGTVNFNTGSTMATYLTLNGNFAFFNDNVGVTTTTFLFQNGYFNGSGNPVFGTNGLVWQGGRFGGTGTATITGGLVASGTNGKVVQNTAIVQLKSTGTLAGWGIDLLGTGKFIIGSGGALTMNIATAQTHNGDNGNVLEVQAGGSLTKTGAGSYTMYHNFNLTGGTVNIAANSGSLIFTNYLGTATWTGGSLTTAANGNFEMYNGVTVNATGVNFSGGGQVVVGSAGNNGILTLGTGCTASGNFYVQFGTLTSNADVSPASIILGNFTTSGTWNGTGNITLGAGGLVWRSGYINGSGYIDVPNNLNLTGNFIREVGGSRVLRLLAANTFTNSGISLAGTARAVVMTGASLTVDVTSAALTFAGPSTTEFEVQGTLTKTGSFEATFQPKLTASGTSTITINGGSLKSSCAASQTISTTSLVIASGCFFNLAGGQYSVYAFATGSGTFRVSNNAAVTLQAGSSFSSSTKLELTGTFTDNVGLSPGLVTFLGGTYAGSGSPTFANGLGWTAGYFTNSGTTTVTGSFSVSGSAPRGLSTTAKMELKSAGTLTGRGLDLTGTSQFIIASGGSLVMTLATSVTLSGATSAKMEVQTGGSLTKSGAGDITLPYQLILSGGSITISANASYISMSANTAQTWTGGTVAIGSGSTFLMFAGTLSASNTAFSGLGFFQMGASISVSTSATLGAGCSVSSKIIVANGTLTCNVDISPNRVELGTLSANGNWAGTGNVTVGSGGLNWRGGTINGSGNFDVANGNFVAQYNYARELGGSRLLRIYGTNNSFTDGVMTMSGTAKTIVMPTGYLQVDLTTANLGFGGNAANEFEVRGQFNKYGTYTLNIPYKLTVSGFFQTLGGIMHLNSTALDNAFTNATITVATGCQLNLNNGTYALNTTAVSGAGNFALNAGSDLVVNMNTGSTMTSKFRLFAGRFNDNVGISPNDEGFLGTGIFNIASGKTAIFNNGFSWAGGTFEGGGTVSLNTVSGGNNARVVRGGMELRFLGNANLTDGTITFLENATARIMSGGVLNFSNPTNDQTVSGTATNLLTVEPGGSLHKNGSKTVSVGLPFQNNGAVTVFAGILRILTGAAHSGAFNVSTGAELRFLENTTVLQNIENNSTIIVEPGKTLTFAGAAAQVLSGNGSITGNVVLDNPNGLTISGSQNIDGILTLTNGKITLINGNLTVGAVANFSPDRFIATTGVGSLRMPVGAAGATFPVGPSTGSYNPIQVAQPVGSDVYSVRVKVGFDPANPPGGTDIVNRQWSIDRSPSNLEGADVTLFWNSPADQQGSFDPTDCHIGHWTGTHWEDFGDAPADCPPPGGFCSRTVTGSTKFSPYGVASGSALALPVELVSFKAKKMADATARLDWQTASETNNRGFDIQRSPDGLDWVAIGFKKGNGTVATLSDYFFVDERPLSGANFYRLRQLDFDGNESFSPIERIDFEPVTEDFSISPNPVAEGGPVFFSIKNQKEGDARLDIFDATGRLVFSQKTELESDRPERLEIKAGHFSPGWHTARLTVGGQVLAKGFLIGSY